MVVYTQGCNRECSYCHNKELITLDLPGHQYVTDAQLFEEIEFNIDYIDAVVFSGGEPTIHDDLATYMKHVKRRGLLVGLHTNGDNITEEVAEMCDYILLSHSTEQKKALCERAKGVYRSRVVMLPDGTYENKLTRIK
jgi:pyruvate-formate lyase-activating enzyme